MVRESQRRARRQMREHQMYMDHSPSYQSAHERYGMSMPIADAERWAKQHGLTLETVIESEDHYEHNFEGERTHVTLAGLWAGLGY